MGGVRAGADGTLLWIKRRYGDIPLYVTENGAAFFDPPTAKNGRVEDALRVDYLREHIGAVREAIGRASTCGATWHGRCSTIWNGRSAIRSASASCTSTSQASSAPQRTARTSTRRSSPQTEPLWRKPRKIELAAARQRSSAVFMPAQRYGGRHARQRQKDSRRAAPAPGRIVSPGLTCEHRQAAGPSPLSRSWLRCRKR